MVTHVAFHEKRGQSYVSKAVVLHVFLDLSMFLRMLLSLGIATSITTVFFLCLSTTTILPVANGLHLEVPHDLAWSFSTTFRHVS